MSDLTKVLSNISLSDTNLIASIVIFSLAIIAGLITLGTAIKFEWSRQSTFKRIFLVLLVIIQVVLLGLMLSNNPIVLLLGTFFVYIIESALVQIYALVTSKQIHDGLVRNQMIPEALDGLYKFVVRMLVIGILISFVSIVSGLPLIWLGQLFSFVSWCAWLHFLNKIRKSLASPRIIRRMFWANIIRIVVQTIIATLLLFFVFSAIASSEIARGEKGNDHQTLSSTSVFFTILLAIDHILRLSLTGYLPWDACYLNRHQFFEEQRMARDPRVELEEDAPEYDDGL